MNGNPVYQPQTVWSSDPLGVVAIKLAGFALLMFGTYRAVLFLEIVVGQ